MPSTNSIVKYGSPSASPISWIATMPGCRSPGLGKEAPDLLRPGEGPGQDPLEGDGPVEAPLPRAVDDPHPAARDLAFDLEVGERHSGPGRRARHGDVVSPR